MDSSCAYVNLCLVLKGIYRFKIMLEMPTIVGNLAHVIDTVEKHAAKLVVMSFNKAANLVFANRLSRQLYYQIAHKLWRWRHTTARKYIDAIQKNLFHSLYELALGF